MDAIATIPTITKIKPCSRERAYVVEGREANEASLLASLSCPFVVQLVAAWESRGE